VVKRDELTGRQCARGYSLPLAAPTRRYGSLIRHSSREEGDFVVGKRIANY
jgi:hypothetical protein